MCRSVDVRQAVLAKNDGLAAQLRADLAARGVTVANLLSSPGSGKTELLELVLRRAGRRGVAAAALTADLATENDAARLARSGMPVKQVLTGGLCHLEAAQLRAHLDGWLPDGTRVLFVENVGNLVCPAGYDLGETLRVTLMSVTEGEDKPLKYPTAFGAAHLVVLTKTDLSEAAGFDEDAFTAAVRRVNPGVEILRTSARTGRGLDDLLDRVLAAATGAALHQPLLAADLFRRYGHDHGDGSGHTHGDGSSHTHGEGPAHTHGAGPSGDRGADSSRDSGVGPSRDRPHDHAPVPADAPAPHPAHTPTTT